MITLNVPDMSCGHCVERITKKLGELGAKVTSSDLETKKVSIDEGPTSTDRIIDALDEIGFSATLAE